MTDYAARIDVLFLAPTYPPEMRRYVRGLAQVGARIFAIGDTPKHALPADSQRYLSAYLAVPRLLDEDDVLERASVWLGGRNLDRVLTNWEPLVMLAARMRERWGVEGMSVDVARAFRDKELMKQRLRAVGLRVPRSVRTRSNRQAWAASESVGFPLVVKPIDGAGSADTYRVDDDEALQDVLDKVAHVPELSVEEYIDGEEFTFDTVCVGGEPRFENVAQYLPKPLESRSAEWISPVIITVRDVQQPRLQGGIELGRKVLTALGMDDGFTHMEWFLTSSGEAVFGEIGARPGGAHLVDQMNYTCDTDLFVEWARAVCWRDCDTPEARQYNVAIVFKRAIGQGRIRGVTGMHDFRRRFGAHIVEENLLPIGASRRNWKHTLLSDGFLMLRHPEWDFAKEMAFAAATDVTMYAD